MIDQDYYWREWCPHCNSPRLDQVTLTRQHGECHCNLEEIQCLHCLRVFHRDKIKRGYDRPAMRRDYNALGKLLTAKGEN